MGVAAGTTGVVPALSDPTLEKATTSRRVWCLRRGAPALEKGRRGRGLGIDDRSERRRQGASIGGMDGSERHGRGT